MIALLAAGVCTTVTVPAATPIDLETPVELSSRTIAKGDRVTLRVARDVVVDGEVVIPAGAEAIAEASEARRTGGVGISGRLALTPLYLMRGEQVVRVQGRLKQNGSLGAAGAVGLVLVTPIISGREARIPAHTLFGAQTLRELSLTLRC